VVRKGLGNGQKTLPGNAAMTLDEALAIAQGRATILVSDGQGRHCVHWHAEVIAQVRAASLQSQDRFDYEVLVPPETEKDTDRFATVEDVMPRRRSVKGHRHADSSLS
jgi:hypothetical protein